MNLIACVYTITCIPTNKIYVGFTTDYLTRLRTHSTRLNCGVHPNLHLQQAFIKYGKSNFIIEILEEYPEEILVAMEHYWGTTLNTHNNKVGFNILPTHPYKENARMAEESKLKISKANKGKKHSEKSKALMSSSRKGKKQSEKHVENRMFAHRGARRTLETRTKMSNNRPKKAINQYDLEGNLIKKWKNINEIVTNLNINSSGLYKCLIDSSNKSNGFKWKYNDKKGI